MRQSMRVVLAASGAEQFRVLHDACVVAGHEPVAYVVSRSMRPRSAVEGWMVTALSEIVTRLPDQVDLLVPASADGLARELKGIGARARAPGRSLSTSRCRSSSTR